MKTISRVTHSLTLASIVLTAYVISTSARALQQVQSGEFPLTNLGESTLGMVLPLVVSAVASITGLFAASRGAGWAPLLGTVLSWLVVVAVLGAEGFRTLF